MRAWGLGLVLVACATPAATTDTRDTLPARPETPCLVLDASSLDFGEVRLGEPVVEQAVVLSNPCGGSVAIESVFLRAEEGDTAFSVVGPLELPLAIEAGDEVRVTVAAAPERYGVLYDELVIWAGDATEPFVAVFLDSVCDSVANDRDGDGDGVPDGCDRCEGFADNGRDRDGDGMPDQCDRCLGFDDSEDADFDTIPDGCDACPGFDDRIDTDEDGIPDGCDG